ncbi:long-chain-fatty-acid--CoA ligase [Rhodococcus pyridinivorans]|uniref:long-chain-fatty-acid--CoA ligase n=1 Tax=Rhodococcus pyridinivorans TaxID=103816 RepID=UPI002078AAFA|nr:long-chain-fatty-acid--CoA ligase [Rhodococcus pyridinivorans]USI92954.1 long-chain-fatty-acid--CoA ligase [Rhodococcus pyridinivorans]
MTPYFTQLTPLSFLRRSADVHPDREAVVYNDTALTYSQFAAMAESRARAFRAAGVRPGDRVAYFMPNVPEALIAQFAVPLAGAVLVAVNTRLASEEVKQIVDHSQAKMLVVDSGLVDVIAHVEFETVETIAVVTDPAAGPASVEFPELADLADAIGDGGKALNWSVADENSLISINYTSGTTGAPKGVMYSHRGAYLSAIGGLIHSKHSADSVYLWTLPMFHCNGWSTGWAVAAAGGKQVCLREVRDRVIWELIDRHRVTHFNCAPTVMISVLGSDRAHRLDSPVTVTLGGAPPSPSMAQEMRQYGFVPIPCYGLTETHGPYAVCEPQDSWQHLDDTTLAKLMSRQGVGMIQAERLRVVRLGPRDGDDLVDVPADGQTMGEIVMRGNNVMIGYFRDPEATERAFDGGWFHSGDLGVMHPDGYVELRDRAKDIVVSGGENISTVEIEQALMSHPAVIEVAVVGVPDDKWGERPKAFVLADNSHSITESELMEYLRGQIARYKVPRQIEFVNDLPKTSTGKIQKFQLKEAEWAGREFLIN